MDARRPHATVLSAARVRSTHAHTPVSAESTTSGRARTPHTTVRSRQSTTQLTSCLPLPCFQARLLFGSHATAFVPLSADSAPPLRAAEKVPAAEKASDGRGWIGPHIELGLTKAGFITADNFCETVRSGFVENEQEISGKFGEWFKYNANENKMVTQDNIVASLIENNQMLCLFFSKEMQEPLSRALKKAIKEALDEYGVLTKANCAEALDEYGVLTKANCAEALDEYGVLTKANFAEALDESKVLTETNFKSTLQAELERNQIKDQLAIKVVQIFAFVLTFHFQHPRLEPLLRAMPTEFYRCLCSLACPLLAAVLAGQTCAILARAAMMQTPPLSDVRPAAP
jgi:hypothetical protein